MHLFAVTLIGCTGHGSPPTTGSVNVSKQANKSHGESGEPVHPIVEPDLQDWPTYEQVSVVARSGDRFLYEFELLAWEELVGARIRVSGWQHEEELLCRVHEKDAQHLELLFEQHGPQDLQGIGYAIGGPLVTMAKDSPGPNWEALQPLGRLDAGEPSSRMELPRGGEWDDIYPTEFVRIPQIAFRLERLLGARYATFTAALNVQSKVERRGTVFLMTGSPTRSSSVRAGVAYDGVRDKIHVLIYDPECMERIDEWSEEWTGMNTDIRAWMTALNDPKLTERRNVVGRGN